MILVSNIHHQFYPNEWDKTSGVKVLQNVSLEVADNTFVSFLGPSGCGKTTLLRMIDGLIIPESGTITVSNQRVAGPSPHCAMVFQEFNLLPWRSVMDNVAFPLELRGLPLPERKSQAQSLIDRVGLSGFEHRFPHQLSGGMKQRVGLARALICGAEYLLMDEPFGALDPQIREIMQIDLLKTWESTNNTVVFVTHDINEAIFLSDQIYIFSHRPGAIKEVVTVDFPRPRWKRQEEITGSAKFAEYRSQIWKILRPEVGIAG